VPMQCGYAIEEDWNEEGNFIKLWVDALSIESSCLISNVQFCLFILSQANMLFNASYTVSFNSTDAALRFGLTILRQNPNAYVTF
jgi:hypothetical protein